MKDYRKKEVLNDKQIDAFETIEINKIKSKLHNEKRFVRRRPALLTVLSVVVVAFVLLVTGGRDLDVIIDPIGTEASVFDVTFTPISIKDLPRSLRGINDEAELVGMNSFGFQSKPKDIVKMNNSFSLDFDLFDEEPDVVGEGQHTLTDIINDQGMYKMAVEAFTNVGLTAPYLTSGVVSTTDEGDEYLYIVHEDGTYEVIFKSDKGDRLEVVEVKNFYLEEELFFEVTVEVIVDTKSDVYRIRYNQDNTKKYQYVKGETTGEFIEAYVSVQKAGGTTNVVAMHRVDDEKYTIVGNATDEYGVIFMEYTSDDQDHVGVEYYNSDGALLKQEYGTEDITGFSEAYEQLFEEFGQNNEITLVNLRNQYPEFSEPESFVVEIPIIDAGVASIETVAAELIVAEEHYEIDYMYSQLLYTKKEDTFTSGDTIYFISNSEVTDTHVVITYSAVYKLPSLKTSANGIDYYTFNRFMGKYIEPKDGYSIEQKQNGQYVIVNDNRVGEIGDRMDIEIKIIEDFFADGEIVPTTVLNYTSDIQIANIVFAGSDTVEQARTNMSLLYSELIPTEEELEENYASIDVSIFE